MYIVRQRDTPRAHDTITILLPGVYYTSVKVGVSCFFCILCCIFKEGSSSTPGWLYTRAVVECYQCVSLSMVVLKVRTRYRHILHLGNNIRIVSMARGVSLYLTMYMYGSYDLYAIPILSPFLFIPSLHSLFCKIRRICFTCLHLFFCLSQKICQMI